MTLSAPNWLVIGRSVPGGFRAATRRTARRTFGKTVAAATPCSSASLSGIALTNLLPARESFNPRRALGVIGDHGVSNCRSALPQNTLTDRSTDMVGGAAKRTASALEAILSGKDQLGHRAASLSPRVVHARIPSRDDKHTLRRRSDIVAASAAGALRNIVRVRNRQGNRHDSTSPLAIISSSHSGLRTGVVAHRTRLRADIFSESSSLRSER